MHNKNKFIIAFGLIVIATIGRLIPHPWNMTPVAAASIFAGVKLGKHYAVIVPLLVMLFGDLVIGFYDWHMLVIVYASMLLVGTLSFLTRDKTGVAVFLGRPLLASIFFFLTTNAAVCFFGTIYSHNMVGLVASYTSGLPFFGRDLLGNLLYTSLFFGVYEYVVHVRRSPIPALFKQSAAR
jgi:hypothetical protein